MRWKKYVAPIGRYRRIRRFLFLPQAIGDEVRWLEWAPILQRYACGAGWVDQSWVDPPTPTEIPAWLFEYADKIDTYAKMNGWDKDWAIGGIQARK